jgi:hypothetical protein
MWQQSRGRMSMMNQKADAADRLHQQPVGVDVTMLEVSMRISLRCTLAGRYNLQATASSCLELMSRTVR